MVNEEGIGAAPRPQSIEEPLLLSVDSCSSRSSLPSTEDVAASSSCDCVYEDEDFVSLTDSDANLMPAANSPHIETKVRS